MPPKGKAIDISSSSVVDLKAQLAQHTQEFQRIRAGAKYGRASNRPTDKKPSVWARQNKGVSSRSKRDEVQHLDQVESQSLERSRETLERKAKLYEEMRKRIHSDDEDGEEGFLIDFDRKYWEEREHQDNAKKRKTREEEDTTTMAGEDDDDDDPWVEYEDEFGRTRTIRSSQLQQQREREQERERSPSTSPSRSPSPLNDMLEPADRASIRHYDSTREVRTRGVGFYQFALDQEERDEQMQRLNEIRQETEMARKNAKSVAERRKIMLQKNAERIHARRAQLQAKRRNDSQQQQFTVDEESVSKFLKAVRSNIES
ncbi:hypothetical protein K492DRAFT_229802 [Lichtheimia hyalospora FSU 10163]|nr:hypothetical protein K492DRAFT_229802 [Lichtheimia hyalospora FSU 10163]